MTFRYYRSCGTCGATFGSDSVELAESERAAHICNRPDMPFLDQVATAVRDHIPCESVSILQPVDGHPHAIIVQTADTTWFLVVTELDQM